ncbi:MAG: GAF domain-containing sensor histidine kinase [Chloroflexota bacterium]
MSQQIAHLRWQAPMFALLLVLIHQIAGHLWFANADDFNFVADVVVYGLIGPAIVWFAMGRIQHRVALKEAAEAELVQAHAELTRLNRRISFLLKINQRVSEVADEESLASLLLQLPGEISPSITGCSLIRFDDHRQPMPVVHRGTVDEPAMVEWHRQLSSPSIRLRCESCGLRQAWAGHDHDCPLLHRSPLQNTAGIVCLPLDRSGREYGTLGLFLAAGEALTEDERNLLEAVINEIAVAFENTRLRTHELAALYEINEALQLRMDFNGLMARILARTVEASHADAGLLLLQNADGSLTSCATAGDWSALGHLPLVESLAAGALREADGEPLVATLRRQTSAPDTSSVLCAPMMADDGPLGVIVLGSRRQEAFLRQQMRLVSAIAAQAALLAQNARLYARLEHQAILAERGRLAREMHDGLAQTLGYLKMRASQIAGWVDAGQTDRAADALHELAQTANNAYLDLRTALDGLRLSLDVQRDTDFVSQLRRCAADFENQTGMAVTLTLNAEAEPTLSMAARSHLLRIVQETLTNIRKHAHATRVTLALVAQDNRTKLLIEDDGQGFDAGRDIPDTRHGLRLMQERADLLGAELQVSSAPGNGTRISIEWPHQVSHLTDSQ